MKKLFMRHNETAWLSRMGQIASTLFISGPSGSGKTTLVRQWVKEQKISARWLTLSTFSTPQSHMHLPDLDFEIALIKWLEQSQEKLIVFDQIQFLNKQNQQILLHTMINDPQERMSIFIADEKIDLPRDIPALSLKGFQKSEMKEFIESFSINLSNKQLDLLYSQTQEALPGLIQNWLQNPQISEKSESEQRAFSEEDAIALKIISILNGKIKTQDIHSFNAEAIENFIARGLILINEDGALILEKHQEKIYLADEHIDFSKSFELAYQFLKKQKNADMLLRFLVALNLSDIEVIKTELEFIEPGQLENLNQNNLLTIINEVEALEKKIKNLFQKNAKLLRVYLHALALTGRREDVVRIAKHYLNIIDWEKSYDLTKQWLSYDMIYWLNRSTHSDLIQENLALFINRSENPVRLYFKIEQGVSLLGLDIERAKETLLRTEKEISQQSDANIDYQIAFAQVNFQLGICYNHQKKYPQAVSYFQIAQEYFKKSKKHYFELFCVFNVSWIYFYTREFNSLETSIKYLRERSMMYGYRYLQAGVDLLDALVAFENMESSKALNKIEGAIDKINKETPLQAQIDIYSAKVRILVDLGLVESAVRQLTFLEQHINKVKKNINLQILKIETQIDFVLIDDFQDLWVDLGATIDSEAYQVYLLQRGFPVSAGTQIKTRRYLCAQIQYDLIQALKGDSQDEITNCLNRLESLLQNVPEPRIEKLAVYCLQASLYSDKKQLYLDRAILEIQRFAADTNIKYFFNEWIDSIQNNQPIDWTSIRPQEKERWQHWLQKTEEKKYTFISLDGSKQLDVVQDTHIKNAIVLREDLGEVYYKSKAVEDFFRKPILRQVLALLFSVYPKHMSKASLAYAMWGETYDPQIHDARIYTSIQRLRKLLSLEVIENWEGGYRWNSKTPFFYYKLNQVKEVGQHKVKTLILESLRKKKKTSQPWLTRAELKEAAASSDATVKRILSELLSENLIIRKGSGPSVVYSLK